MHRVVFPSCSGGNGGGGEEEGEKGVVRDRYSIAYFCHPCRETELVAVPSEMVRARVEGCGEMEGRKVLTAAEHLNGRLAATYGWAVGSETGKA